MYTQNPPIEKMAEVAAEQLGGNQDDYLRALQRSLGCTESRIQINVYGDGTVTTSELVGADYVVHHERPVAVLELPSGWETTEEEWDEWDYDRDTLERWERTVQDARVEALEQREVAQ